jgi:hypothetical protein
LNGSEKGHPLKVRVNKQNHSVAKNILFLTRHSLAIARRPQRCIGNFVLAVRTFPRQTPGLQNVLSSHPSGLSPATIPADCFAAGPSSLMRGQKIIRTVPDST